MSDKPTKTVLPVGGALTRWRAEELKGMLLKALEGANFVEIDVNAVQEVDLTGLQLLCSAHRAAVEQGRTVALRDRNPLVMRLAHEAGFIRHEGCKPGCLWLEG